MKPILHKSQLKGITPSWTVELWVFSVCFEMNLVLHFSQSNDEKIILSGSSNPYIRFRSGSTDKGYIQMHSNGNMYLVNQETSESLKIGSGSGGLTFTHNGT